MRPGRACGEELGDNCSNEETSRLCPTPPSIIRPPLTPASPIAGLLLRGCNKLLGRARRLVNQNRNTDWKPRTPNSKLKREREVGDRQRERETETETERQRERHTQTERQRQTKTDRERQRQRHTERNTERNTERQRLR